ncbi:PspC domain-containing protein [Actinomyces sp.]|uniref:PspC domain-containing protein n=1 Tax=Actinomyces sp. TaxID=29317 RepID=UPI0026DCFA1E|nr:PspC domain-containing protein [Actinomyces sp.]MDO4900300.1 PspC domain-containing protein [Actinomyces sp.]
MPPPGAVPPPHNAAFPPPGTGAPTPPRRPATAGFFDSLRRAGLARTNERWIAGVAGGVARRLGLDPTLVRCVWVVLVVFTGLGLVLYGLGWALMPEESDGRIHFEQVLSGDFDAGFAGAVATFISGWVLIDHGLIPSWYIRGWAGWGYYDLLWSVVGTCLVVGAVYCGYRVIRSSRRPYPQPPTPGGPGPAGPTTMPSAGPPHAGTPTPYPAAPVSNVPGPQAGPRPAGATMSAGHPGVPMRAMPPAGPPPRPIAPVLPRRPGPGHRLGQTVAGIIFCCLAAIVLLWYTGHMGPIAAWLAAIGAVTALLGAGVVISALRHRRGGWMTGLGWLAAVIAVPSLMLGTGVPGGALSARDTTWSTTAHTVTLTWDDLKRQFSGARGNANTIVSLGDYAAGRVVLDLTDMPAGAEPRVRAALSIGVGTVTIRTSAEQNLSVNSTVGAGPTYADTISDWATDGGVMTVHHNAWHRSRYTVNGDSVTSRHSERWHPGELVSLRSPAAQEAGTALSLDIEVGVGAVNVDEQPNQVTWYGLQDDAAWIVESWVDEHGKSHDTLPVPGMTHTAIGTETATTCSEAVTDALADAASDDGDDPDDWEDQGWYGDWYGVSELTGVGRAAWDDCVDEALRTGAGPDASEPSPEPSASSPSTAAPSPSAAATEPSPTPTH